MDVIYSVLEFALGDFENKISCFQLVSSVWTSEFCFFFFFFWVLLLQYHCFNKWHSIGNLTNNVMYQLELAQVASNRRNPFASI